MEQSVLFSQVLILFLIMLIGGLARKANVFTSDFNKGLSAFVLNISLPCLIINSLNIDYSPEIAKSAGMIFILGSAFHIFAILFGKLFFASVAFERYKIFRFGAVFSNCGFMGFPILESLLGKIGVFYCSIYNIVFHIFLWTFGIYLFSENKETSLKKILLNPGTISVFIGLFIFFFSIQLPVSLKGAVSLLASTATPLAMVVIGIRLSDSNPKAVLKDYPAYIITFVRLIILPLILLVTLKFLKIEKNVVSVCVMLAAMPIAANTTIFAEKFSSNPEFASRCVFVSTTLSMLTVPIIASLL